MIIALTGEQGTGKTFLIGQIIEFLKDKKKKITGVISLPVFDQGKKKAIDVLSLKSQQKRRLAIYKPGWDIECPTRKWMMLERSLEWGNKEIIRAIPTDFLFLDEIGYLEIEKKTGWISTFDVLQSNLYFAAFIVVRKSLLDQTSSFFNISKIIDMDLCPQKNYNFEPLLDEILSKMPK